MNQYNFILATDTKDIIFQRNPDEWFDYMQLCEEHFFCGGEGIKLQDEEWGRNNMMESFGGEIYADCKYNEIANSGTISGRFEDTLDLFLNIFLVACTAKSRVSDQDALNVLLSMFHYRALTRICNSEDAYSAQLGTFFEPKYSGSMLYQGPVLYDGELFNPAGEKYLMVHQYDRFPVIAQPIYEKYWEA
jgi:hypothetical protein